MPAAAPTEAEEFRDELIAHALLVPTGVPGLFGRSRVFEDIVERFDRFVTAAGAPAGPEVLRFPPLIPRAAFERSEYLKSFPQLAGVVCSFCGTDADHHGLLREVEQGGDWARALPATDVVLTPAACYPVYATAAPVLPPGGRLVDVASYCFRHEPSPDPARMQMFRMHEFVRLGSAGETVAFRDRWLVDAAAMLRRVGLSAEAVPANDPFFGRAGRMLAANQREQSLKFELVVPIASADRPTAVVSCNYHQDHFGLLFGLSGADGSPAHTACVGFGLERIALALFRAHGFDPAAWPAGVRATLAL